jgi:hypothetical protein
MSWSLHLWTHPPPQQIQSHGSARMLGQNLSEPDQQNGCYAAVHAICGSPDCRQHSDIIHQAQHTSKERGHCNNLRLGLFYEEGQEWQGGLFTGDAGEVAIVLPPAAIEEAADSLWKLLTLIGVGDDASLGVTDTLAAAQGPGGEVAKDIGKHIVWAVVHYVPHVADLLHLEGHHQLKRWDYPAMEFHQ